MQACPSFPVSSAGQLIRFKRLIGKVYIFRHKTVTGVYISTSIKYALFQLSVLRLEMIIECSGFIFFSALYYLPQFFQVALGYSPLRAGKAVFILIHLF